MSNGKQKERIRDPLYDLIEFQITGANNQISELESYLWKVVQSRPFQRLRRVKQLGFSDLVYPGATHSRFAHSIGVFHTARQLMDVVRLKTGGPSTFREMQSLAAALVHDLGHGPFSHAFEDVGKKLGLKLADHEHMSDALIRDSEVSVILNKIDPRFADNVADIIKKDGVKTVEHAVVSSQFDADRLDYMRRDRLMTGTQHAAIDFKWLIANLEIASVAIGVDDKKTGEIETFVLGPKALYAAEAFVLGLFQLYPTVYFHKATRSAEKIFSEILVRIVTLVRDGNKDQTGLPPTHPLICFSQNPDDLNVALTLDDTVVWGALTQMCDAIDPFVSKLSKRLRDRELYKCFDIRAKVTHELDPKYEDKNEILAKIEECCAKISFELKNWEKENRLEIPRILIDEADRPPYKNIDKSKGPLDRINIRTDGGLLVDLKERSSVVRALKDFKLLRVYADKDDQSTMNNIKRIVTQEIRKWQTKTPTK